MPIISTLIIIAVVPSFAQLEIILEPKYDPSKSPLTDPGGRGLDVIFEEAVEYWENIFPDIERSTIEIKYLWAGENKMRKKKRCSYANTDRPAGSLSPNKFRIRVFTSNCGGEIDWFIDDDPWEHFEFTMSDDVLCIGRVRHLPANAICHT